MTLQRERQCLERARGAFRPHNVPSTVPVNAGEMVRLWLVTGRGV